MVSALKRLRDASLSSAGPRVMGAAGSGCAHLAFGTVSVWWENMPPQQDEDSFTLFMSAEKN